MSMMTHALPTARLSTEQYRASQRRIALLLGASFALASFACSYLVARFEMAAAPLLLCALVAPILVMRPLLGLLSIYAFICIFETQSRFDALMLPGRYVYVGLNSAVGITGVILSPLEILLGLVVLSWFVRMRIERREAVQRGAFTRQMLLFSVALAAGLIRGLAGGGDAYIAFWECRALIYVLLTYLAATQIVRTPKHLNALLWISLLAPTVFAIEGAYRRLYLVDDGLIDGDLVFDHDDPIFLDLMLLVVLAQLVFGGSRWQRRLGLAMSPIVVFTLFASERRAGLIGLAVALIAFMVVLAVTRRRAFLMVTPVLILTASIYLPIFWSSTNVIAQPARAIRSIVDPNDRDAASNEYRDLEKINVNATIAANPVLGVGFGREYLFVVPLPAISDWLFLPYQPHHNIQWVWLKIGAAGFVIFWVLIGSALARAAYLTRTLHDPNARTFAFVTLGTLITILCYSYVDTSLVSQRITVLLGMLLGTLAVLERLAVPPTTAADRRP
ncbi:MAG: O-antigen ligase family protein [Chloroflexi bacterium]|nr:O-antigen ligase family protein [Chloroflexota bacterium]